MDLPAYVINLDRSPERLCAVTNAFGKFGIQLERFAGIDALNNSEVVEQALNRIAFKCYMRRDAAQGEVGCALSHFALWDSLTHIGHEFILVVEDDAVPTEHVLRIGELAAALPDDWEILLLFSGGKVPLCSIRAGSLTIKRYLKPGYYAVGYLVHRRILKHRALWQREQPVRFALDAWRFWTWMYGFSIYTVNEPVVFGAPGAVSTMDASGSAPRVAPVRPGFLILLRAFALRLVLYPLALWHSGRAWFYLNAPGPIKRR